MEIITASKIRLKHRLLSINGNSFNEEAVHLLTNTQVKNIARLKGIRVTTKSIAKQLKIRKYIELIEASTVTVGPFLFQTFFCKSSEYVNVLINNEVYVFHGAPDIIMPLPDNVVVVKDCSNLADPGEISELKKLVKASGVKQLLLSGMYAENTAENTVSFISTEIKNTISQTGFGFVHE